MKWRTDRFIQMLIILELIASFILVCFMAWINN